MEEKRVSIGKDWNFYRGIPEIKRPSKIKATREVGWGDGFAGTRCRVWFGLMYFIM
jgi:hypothetical protein